MQKNTQSTNIIIRQGLIKCKLNTLHDWQYSTVKLISLKSHDSPEPSIKMFKSAKLLYDENKVYQTTKLSQTKLTKNTDYVIS